MFNFYSWRLTHAGRTECNLEKNMVRYVKIEYNDDHIDNIMKTWEDDHMVLVKIILLVLMMAIMVVIFVVVVMMMKVKMVTMILMPDGVGFVT